MRRLIVRPLKLWSALIVIAVREQPPLQTLSRINESAQSIHLLLLSIEFHQSIQECPSFVDRRHADALVQAVNMSAVGIDEKSLDAVRRNSCWIHELRIGSSG